MIIRSLKLSPAQMMWIEGNRRARSRNLWSAFEDYPLKHKDWTAPYMNHVRYHLTNGLVPSGEDMAAFIHRSPL